MLDGRWKLESVIADANAMVRPLKQAVTVLTKVVWPNVVLDRLMSLYHRVLRRWAVCVQNGSR